MKLKVALLIAVLQATSAHAGGTTSTTITYVGEGRYTCSGDCQVFNARERQVQGIRRSLDSQIKRKPVFRYYESEQSRESDYGSRGRYDQSEDY
jgi:hypothetical protein